MAKAYFVVSILRGVDHLYIKGKDEDRLRDLAAQLGEMTGQGRLDRDPIEVSLTHRGNPKTSPPLDWDSQGSGGLLLSDRVLAAMESAGYADFKAVPVLMKQSAKRTWDYWLLRETTSRKLPLEEDVACFREHRSTQYYMSEHTKEALETIEDLVGIRFEVPYHIDTF